MNGGIYLEEKSAPRSVSVGSRSTRRGDEQHLARSCLRSFDTGAVLARLAARTVLPTTSLLPARINRTGRRLAVLCDPQLAGLRRARSCRFKATEWSASARHFSSSVGFLCRFSGWGAGVHQANRSSRLSGRSAGGSGMPVNTSSLPVMIHDAVLDEGCRFERILTAEPSSGLPIRPLILYGCFHPRRHRLAASACNLVRSFQYLAARGPRPTCTMIGAGQRTQPHEVCAKADVTMPLSRLRELRAI